MIHTLSKEYGWSKSQIDEIYPKEANILIQFIASEKGDAIIQKQIDYYVQNIDNIKIAHAEKLDEVYKSFVENIQKLQNLKIKIDDDDIDDDEIPDFDRLQKLKEFKKST